MWKGKKGGIRYGREYGFAASWRRGRNLLGGGFSDPREFASGIGTVSYSGFLILINLRKLQFLYVWWDPQA